MVERDRVTTTSSPYAFDDSPTAPPASVPASGAAYERSSDEIRQNIAATRDSITETVDQLSSRVQRTFDWKTYVADYPLAATGVAAGLGIVLGYLARPRTTPKERIHGALAEMAEDAAHRFQEQFNDLGFRRPGLGQTLRATAIATIVQMAGDFARNRFDGKDELQDQEMEDQAIRHADGSDAVNASYYAASPKDWR